MFFLVSSCLEDKGYTDIINAKGSGATIVSWYGNEGTPNQRAVALPSDKDTTDYELHVSVTSSHPLNKAFTVTVAIDQTVIDETNATIEKEADKFTLLPDSVFSIPSFTVTVPADTTEAPFVITFIQHRLDKGKNYMLPLKIQDLSGTIVGSTTRTAKLTWIGNPLAGSWSWDYIRYNNQDGSGSPSTYTPGGSAIFSPVDGTSFKVPTGYYVQPNYLVTFTNNGGVLSDFKAVIAPDEIQAAFTDNGITVVQAPKITVNADYTKFTINYVVFNGSAYRNITDIFYK